MKTIGALIVALSLSIFIAWPMLREIYYSWQEGNKARRNRQKHALGLEAMANSFGQNVHVIWETTPNSKHETMRFDNPTDDEWKL